MVVAKLQDRYVHPPLKLVTTSRRKLNIYSDLWRAVLESTGQGMLKGHVAASRQTPMKTRLHQIKASAGSGKTYTLTSQFINALGKCGQTTPSSFFPAVS